MIEKALLVLVCVLFNLVALFLIRKHSRANRFFLSIPLLFYIIFTTFVGLGSVVIYLDQDLLINTLNLGSLDDNLFNHALQMNLGIMFFAFGVAFTALVTNFSAYNEITAFQESRILIPNKPLVIVNLLLVGSAIALVLIYIFMSELEVVPLFTALSNVIIGESSDLSRMRGEVADDTSIPGAFVQLMRYVLPFALTYIWILQLRHLRRSSIFVLAIILSSITVFVLFSLGQRAPVIEYLVCCILMMNYIRPPKKFPLKLTTSLVMAFVIIFVLMSILLERSGTAPTWLELISLYLDELFYRIFITHAQTGSYLYQLIPNTMEFKGWDIYIENLRGYLPGRHLSFSHELFSYVHDWVGSASHSSLAEAYASFGLTGVLSVALLLGTVCQYLMVRFVRGRKSEIRIIFYGFISVSMTGPAIGSLTGIPYNGLLTTSLLYLLIASSFGLLGIRER